MRRGSIQRSDYTAKRGSEPTVTDISIKVCTGFEFLNSAISIAEGIPMKLTQRNSFRAVSVAILLSLGACSGMSEREKNTSYGAAAGGVAGAVLGGGVLGTLGGAAVGGVIGHEVTKDNEKDQHKNSR